MQWLIKSATGGISDYDDKGLKGAYKAPTKGLDLRRDADTLYCQQALVDITPPSGGFLDLILWFVKASDGNIYGFGDAGRIYKFDSSLVCTKVYTDPIGRITGAAERYNSSGENYLTWTTATNVNQKILPGNGNVPWDDLNPSGWPKTNLDSYIWHTTRWIAGALLIANKNKLAMVGYDDSYTNEALTLFPDDIAKALIERGEHAVIGAGKDNTLQKGSLYSWRPQIELNYQRRKSLPSKTVNAMIDTEVPLILAGTNGGILYSDLISFLPVKEIPGGGQVYPDGVDELDGLAILGLHGGSYPGVYKLGRHNKNKQFTLTLDYPMDVDEIGAVTNTGSTILASYRDGSTYGVKKIDSTTKQTGYYFSLDLYAPKRFEDPVNWENVVLHTRPMPAGTAIEVYYRVDKVEDNSINANADSDGWIQAKMQGEVSQFTATGGTSAVFLLSSIGKVIEIKIKIIPNGNISPEIYFPIEINFTP